MKLLLLLLLLLEIVDQEAGIVVHETSSGDTGNNPILHHRPFLGAVELRLYRHYRKQRKQSTPNESRRTLLCPSFPFPPPIRSRWSEFRLNPKNKKQWKSQH
ncbi:unnamed protein product [Linum tenue]|uniref:Secreted protein n=1 Tax=Linum tenue TaxID=586396 RepID=A0AAV0M605_9ROSI|nr:unnamed protein product [Linum tenue]